MASKFIKIRAESSGQSLTLRKKSPLYQDLIVMIGQSNSVLSGELLVELYGQMVLQTKIKLDELKDQPFDDNRTFVSPGEGIYEVSFFGFSGTVMEGEKTSSWILYAIEIINMIKSSLISGKAIILEDVNDLRI